MPKLIRPASMDSPEFDYYRTLKRTNHTRDQTHFIAEGEKLVLRLLDLEWPLTSLVTSDRQLDRIEHVLPADVTTYVVSQEQLERLVGYNFHRGMLALAKRMPMPSIEELATSARRLVVCSALRDPTNLGVVIRTAAAFGWDGVILEPGSPDPFSRRVLRTSMAAVLRMPISTTPLQRELPHRLASQFGFETICAIAHGRTEPGPFTDNQKVALWLGNEDAGLEDAIANACRHQWTVKTTDRVDSLNVAVAAGIFLHRLGISNHSTT